jgi:hypothetical protein
MLDDLLHPTWILSCQKIGHVFLTAGSAKTLKEINLRRCGIGGERFVARVRSIIKCHRHEPVTAGPAMPEIGDAARTVFNPVRRGDRLAALGAGILVR